jgi:hypothetical protein
MPGRFPLVPIAVTDDPFCEDDYCGEPSASPFDPYDYNYFRWNGTFTTGVDGIQRVEDIVSNWALLTPGRYGRINAFASSSGNISNISGPQAPWTASATYEINTFISGGSPLVVQDNTAFLLAASTWQVRASEFQQPCQTIVGRWQFSLNGTDVATEWAGITIPYP